MPVLSESLVFRATVAAAHRAATNNSRADIDEVLTYSQFSLRGERVHCYIFDISAINPRAKHRVEEVHALKEWLVKRDIPVSTTYEGISLDPADSSPTDFYASLEGDHFDPPAVINRLYTDRRSTSPYFVIFLTNSSLNQIEQVLISMNMGEGLRDGSEPDNLRGGGRDR